MRARLGSRLRYRLLGASTAREHLPTVVSARATEGLVKIRLESDKGYYVVHTSRHRKVMQSRMQDLRTLLEEAARRQG